MTPPKHTPTPWIADDNEGFSHWSIYSRMAPSGSGPAGVKIAVLAEDSDEADANALLIVRAVNSHAPLLAALEAQELLSTFSCEMAKGHSIAPDDPRYTPYIGEWDGYQAPEMRMTMFVCKRREMRAAALSAAKGGAL